MKALITNTILLISLISFAYFLYVFSYTQVYALDPSEETFSCFGNEEGISSEGRPCLIVNCRWRNIANNWPDDTGYEEDCSNSSEVKPSKNRAWLYLFSGSGLFIIITVAAVVMHKKSQI